MNFLRIIVILTAILLLVSCGGDNGSPNGDKLSSASFLPENIESAGLTRSSEVKTYVGDSLYEYINGGSEVYHQYGFEEVSMAYYKKGEAEIVLDVYRFDTPSGSYGLYSSLKYDDIEVLDFGVEGYQSGNRIDFIKDKYLIRITAYDETAGEIITSAAAFMSNLIPGSAEPPALFSLFPNENQLPLKKIFAESYLGVKDLSMVYTVDYISSDDTVTFFLTEDVSGNKFLSWKNSLTEMGTTSETADGLTYDKDLSFKFEHPYYGPVICGLKKGKLVGMINFTDKQKLVLTDWLNSL